MRERGQVFTLDMLFALILVAAIISVSGQAFELASGQAESYSTRYSLERTVNDAADVLVKTSGRPDNWEDNLALLETLGFATESAGAPVQNTLDVKKLGSIRELCGAGNWDPAKSEVQAVMALFGGSENFEIKVAYKELLAREPLADLDLDIKTTLFGVEVDIEADNEDGTIEVDVELEWDHESESGTESAPAFTMVVTGGGLTIEVIVGGGVIEIWYKIVLWDIWPGWDVEDSSGVENSLEVAVVRRSVGIKSGDVVAEIRALKHIATPEDHYLDFFVYPGELDVYDWYVLLSKAKQPTTEIWVNRSAGGADYNSQADGTVLCPRYHGVDDLPKHNSVPLTDVENNGNPNNYLIIRVTGNPGEFVDVYVVAVPRCSPVGAVELAPRIRSATLEVKLWR